MTYDEIMTELERLGSDQTKRTLIRHGAREPFFGVKIGDLKKLVKFVKKDQELAKALYASGNSDAMYLAGLSIDPKGVSRELLQEWADNAYWYLLAEYTVAGVTAESRFGHELALAWIESREEMIAACGWSTYAGMISVLPDERLELEEIRSLLIRVRREVHGERNRVRYAMNGFVISVGSFIKELQKEALETAQAIGTVQVNMGQTACKVPLAEDYIAKVASMGRTGVKKKTCIC